MTIHFHSEQGTAIGIWINIYSVGRKHELTSFSKQLNDESPMTWPDWALLSIRQQFDLAIDGFFWLLGWSRWQTKWDCCGCEWYIMQTPSDIKWCQENDIWSAFMLPINQPLRQISNTSSGVFGKFNLCEIRNFFILCWYWIIKRYNYSSTNCNCIPKWNTYPGSGSHDGLTSHDWQPTPLKTLLLSQKDTSTDSINIHALSVLI
jgi:hypothetical protein